MLLASHSGQADPVATIDILTTDPANGLLLRVYGSAGEGHEGTPVAGGWDMDGDGHNDYAIAHMVADPLGRTHAGQVFLVFGDGTIQGEVDTFVNDSRVLAIYGDQDHESAGSEIWMADVTGDGLGDLIICRQNHSYDPPGAEPIRIGSGALTIIPGQLDILRDRAGEDKPNDRIDLGDTDDIEEFKITTIYGANAGDRLCIWARNGNLTSGDTIDDIAVAADQEEANGDTHSGAVYLIRGGPHLLGPKIVDLANLKSTSSTNNLPGNIARVRLPANPTGPDTDTAHYHLGATLYLADLNGNGYAELMAAAALNRHGAQLSPDGMDNGHGGGGTDDGTVYIVWDDNYPASLWLTGNDTLDITIGAGAGSSTEIIGGDGGTPNDHDSFGEELLGGMDYDNDGNADLFVGDLVADTMNGVDNGNNVGSGHVFYNAANLKNYMTLSYDSLPASVKVATFLGPSDGAISADTAMHGDFNGDGIDDLAFSAPNDSPITDDSPGGRFQAGILYVILGRNSQWPTFTNLAPASFPSASDVQIFTILGREAGDMLAYSGASGDINKDGAIDIITNEMVGDGAHPPGTDDVGNLIIIDGYRLGDLLSGPCFPIKAANGNVVVVCL